MPTRQKTPLLQQPAYRRLRKLLARKRGMTIAKLAERSNVEEHTVRAMLSRMRSAGLNIGKERSRSRGMVFRICGL